MRFWYFFIISLLLHVSGIYLLSKNFRPPAIKAKKSKHISMQLNEFKEIKKEVKKPKTKKPETKKPKIKKQEKLPKKPKKVKKQETKSKKILPKKPNALPTRKSEVKKQDTAKEKIIQENRQMPLENSTTKPIQNKDPQGTRIKEQEVSNATKFDIKNYLYKVHKIINQHKTYPKRAKLMRIEGGVLVEATIDKNGALLKKVVARSSGYKFLDKHSLQRVQKAALYFPKPPKTITIRVLVSYKLN